MWAMTKPSNEAINLAQRAVNLTQGDVEALNTLSLALLCAGHLDEAEKNVRAALAEQPASPSCLVTLAAIHQARGNSSEARSELEKARTALELSATGASDPDLARRIAELSQLLESDTSSDLSDLLPRQTDASPRG